MRRASGDKISIPEIAGRLLVGRMAVYQLLESRTIPANRLGWRRIVTRHAYEQVGKDVRHERCSAHLPTGLETSMESATIVPSPC
jgi:excisionase family DNA binding protein